MESVGEVINIWKEIKENEDQNKKKLLTEKLQNLLPRVINNLHTIVCNNSQGSNYNKFSISSNYFIYNVSKNSQIIKIKHQWWL